MSAPNPASRRLIQRGHLYLVPPLSEDGSETPAPSKPATFPWDTPATTPSPWGMPSKPSTPYQGRAAYVHTLPSTPPDDHHDHPPRRRVVWQRPDQTRQEDN